MFYVYTPGVILPALSVFSETWVFPCCELYRQGCTMDNRSWRTSRIGNDSRTVYIVSMKLNNRPCVGWAQFPPREVQQKKHDTCVWYNSAAPILQSQMSQKTRGHLVQDGTGSFDGAESSLHFRLLSHEPFQTSEVTAGHEIEIEAWAYRQKWWHGSVEIFFVSTVAGTPKLRFWSRLPWWPHFMNNSMECSTPLLASTSEQLHKFRFQKH